MVISGSKKAQTVFFSVILWVLVAYLKFYFRVNVSCKLAFEEKTCKIIAIKFVNFSSVFHS